MAKKAKRAQLSSAASVDFTGALAVTGKLSDSKIREMRREPTIKLARMMVRAPIMATGWTVECDEPSLRAIANDLHSMVMPLRYRFLEAATAGCIDYGWQAFEKVFALENGRYTIKRLKPLLQAITKLLVDEETGSVSGLINTVDSVDVELSKVQMALVNIDVEGDNHYGESYFAAVERPYDALKVVENHARIYDKKIAGAHWVVYYPPGSSTYNGADTDNAQIASDLISKLESSGSFAIPRGMQDLLEDLNTAGAVQQWDIQLKESTGSGANFDQRMQRCDVNIVRAFGLPERAILEGQFGTKAEAVAHGDFAITGIELLHHSIVTQFNDWVTNSLIRLNYGDEFVDRIYVKANALNDADRDFIRELYRMVVATPEGALTELSALDMASIRDRLNIPYTENNDGSNTTNFGE